MVFSYPPALPPTPNFLSQNDANQTYFQLLPYCYHYHHHYYYHFYNYHYYLCLSNVYSRTGIAIKFI